MAANSSPGNHSRAVSQELRLQRDVLTFAIAALGIGAWAYVQKGFLRRT